MSSTRTDKLFGARLALARGGLLRRLDLRQNAEQILDVMAYLVRDDISVGEVAAAAEAPFHVLEEGRVEIDLLIPRAIERPHGRLGAAAARGGPPAIEDEFRLDVGNPFLPWQDFRPDGFVRGENGGDELAHVVGGRPGLPRLRRVVCPPWRILLTISAPPIRSRGSMPSAQPRRPRTTTVPMPRPPLPAMPPFAAPVLDIVRTAEILPFHERLPLVILSRPRGPQKPRDKLEFKSTGPCQTFAM